MSVKHTFSKVLSIFSQKDGNEYYAAREAWGAEYILIQIPDKGSKMRQAYLYFETGKGAKAVRVPWTPSQQDMFASDWFIHHFTDGIIGEIEQ